MVQYSETTMNYELKPLKVGGILDQTILIFKNNFSFFVKLMLCLQIPVAIVVQLVAIEKLPVPSPHPTPEEFSEFFQAQMLFFFTVMVPLSLLLAIVIAPFTYGVLILSAARIYLGQTVGVRHSFRAVLGRVVPLAWTWILLYFLIVGGLALCALPGILFLFWFALTSTVVVLERTSGISAFRRSWYLMRSAGLEHYLQIFLLGVVIFFIQLGIGAGAAVIPQRHVEGVLGALLQTLAVTFGTIASVVFYYSCRCRVENFDLVQLAKAVASAPTAPLKNTEQG